MRVAVRVATGPRSPDGNPHVRGGRGRVTADPTTPATEYRSLRGRRTSVALAWILAAVLAVTGCVDWAYLVPAGLGQADLLGQARPITAVLANAALDAEQRRKLELIRDVRDFGRTVVGLYTHNQYDTFVDGRGAPLAFNLTAARRDRLQPHEWWFPVVGFIPYLGFFDEAAVRARAADLESQGYDTFFYALDAYNLGGNATNPVLSPLLERPDADIVNVILHELLHATVLSSSSVDFNESLATFVGQRAAVEYYERHHPDEPGRADAARAFFADVERFADFMNAFADRLDRHYEEAAPGTALTLREEWFAAERQRFADDVQPLMNDPVAFEWVARLPTNNAFVLGSRRYNADRDLFAAVLEASGSYWPAAIGVYRAAADTAAPFLYLTTWLADHADGAPGAPRTAHAALPSHGSRDHAVCGHRRPDTATTR